MTGLTDQQLLRDYRERQTDAAFAELVRRHVDLVHSATLRMVRDAHLAEDVTQAVFMALAQNALDLTARPVLTGWLHRTAQNLAAKAVRTDVRRRAREQEAATMNELLADSGTGVSPVWAEIAPHLDAALGELSEPDHDAILLRYFENKSLREVGQALGTSEDAAQKRVNRAVDRLREFFAKRGVTVGAGGLVVVISANAVQAAPVGLAVTISTAVAVAGTTLAATAMATKVIAMTTLQKTIIGATLAVAVGTGIFEARDASQLRGQVQTLRQQQVPLAEQIHQLQRERDEATNRLALLGSEIAKVKSNNLELLKLRGDVGVLRAQLKDANAAGSKIEQPPLSTAIEYYRRAERHGKEHDCEAQLDDLNKAIELDPNLAEAYTDRALLYANNLPSSRGGSAKAVADYTRYLELRPRDAVFRHNRGLLYESLGQSENAISDYSMLIQGDLDFEGIGSSKNKFVAIDCLCRGRVYHRQKHDYARAISDYTAALALDPQIVGAHRLRGQCYELLGEMEKAQQDFAIESRNN